MTAPHLITPAELASKIGCSERTLRRLAREHGACHIIGKTMILTDEDVVALMEATRLRPLSSTGRAPAATTGVRLPEGTYDDLVRSRTRQALAKTPKQAKSPPR